MIGVCHAATVGTGERGPDDACHRPYDRVQNRLRIESFMNERRQRRRGGERCRVNRRQVGHGLISATPGAILNPTIDGFPTIRLRKAGCRRPVRAASLSGGRVPERTNGPVSKTVEAFCVSVGSNPTPSARSGSGGAVSNLATATGLCRPPRVSGYSALRPRSCSRYATAEDGDDMPSRFRSTAKLESRPDTTSIRSDHAHRSRRNTSGGLKGAARLPPCAMARPTGPFVRVAARLAPRGGLSSEFRPLAASG